MRSSAGKIQMAAFEDLFQADAGQIQERVREIPLSELHPFPNHPFQVRDDDAMRETAESVKKYGVLTPALVRPRDEGGYEIVSGHRRARACELVGLETIPCIVRDIDNDAATILMVDSNLQRDELLPSEKAWAYRLKLEAMKHQGERMDLTSAQVGRKFIGKESRESLAEQVGESRNQISRYIRLTELLPELLNMVDEKKLPFNPAVELSYLTKEEQAALLELMEELSAVPSLEQSKRLKAKSQAGLLDADFMREILAEIQSKPLKITLRGDTIRQYFPSDYTREQMEEVIFSLLTTWKTEHT